MVENEINVPILLLNTKMFLPGDERKAVAEFQEKPLKVSQDGALEVRLMKCRRIRQSQKLQHIGILE